MRKREGEGEREGERDCPCLLYSVPGSGPSLLPRPVVRHVRVRVPQGPGSRFPPHWHMRPHLNAMHGLSIPAVLHPLTHIYTKTYTHTHTHTQTNAHTDTYTYTHTYPPDKQTHTHTCTRTHHRHTHHTHTHVLSLSLSLLLSLSLSVGLCTSISTG